MVKTNICLPIEYNTEIIKRTVAAHLPIDKDEICEPSILRRQLIITDSVPPIYRVTVAFSADPEKEQGLLKMRKKVSPYEPFSYTPPAFCGDFRPIVVGSGPAGLFAALTLAEAGAMPILIERGLPVEERAEKISLFERLGILDEECNVQFGEGGAGTYSDGKLKVGAMDEYKAKVIDSFIASGATEDIAFSTTAHLGTDRLPSIIRSLRERLISLGGEVIFSARLTGLSVNNGSLSAIEYEKDGQSITLEAKAVVLATGHSARDTLRMLYGVGLPIRAKGFGVGMRIEHPREYIDRIIYRKAYGKIPYSASYHLVTHLPNGRSVYSFCMCPGGSVVAATSCIGSVVTNGMSPFARNEQNSNAALLVSVTPEDFGSDHPLAGIEFQERIERVAFSLTEGYKAPGIGLASLMDNSAPNLGKIKPSYPRGVEPISPEGYMPQYIPDSIREAMREFDAWTPGFAYPDATLTGPETRTTSPVRIERGDSGEALGFEGIYPCGEGAGYAGGIISSATDGIRIAEKLILKYS